MTKGRKGLVRLDGMPVGRMEESERGTRFTYDATWLSKTGACPVSLTLSAARRGLRQREPAYLLQETLA